MALGRVFGLKWASGVGCGLHMGAIATVLAQIMEKNTLEDEYYCPLLHNVELHRRYLFSNILKHKCIHKLLIG